jgi:hypothetical protein
VFVKQTVLFLFYIYLSTSNGTNNGSFLVLVIQTFTSKESRTTLRELDDKRRLDVTSSFKSSVYGTIREFF